MFPEVLLTGGQRVADDPTGMQIQGDLQQGSVGLHLLLLIRTTHHFHHQI
jgi:hypothetical protein